MDSYFPVVARTKLKKESSQVVSTSKSPKLAGPQSVAGVCLARDEESVNSYPKDMPLKIIENSRSILVRNSPCSSDITDRLLRTLSDPMNPITHSNIADRTDHYVAFSTGHQVAGGRINQGSYMASREDKLRVQHDEISKSRHEGNDNILKGTRIYVNGYLESTTDLEVKRTVIQLGGQLVYAFLVNILRHF